MTEKFEYKNGLKFDTIEIREETNKLNFNMGAYIATSVALEVLPSTIDLVWILIALTLVVLNIIYGLKALSGLMKLDFIFMGQFIRDAESVGSWIVNLFRKNKR